MESISKAIGDRAGGAEATLGGAQTDRQQSIGSRPRAWQGRSAAAGIAGSVIATLCCLPAAAAIALGLGLGTVATLSELLAYQRLFQVAGVGFAGVTAWLMLRRNGSACGLSEKHRERVPVLVMASFAASFAILNLLVVPILERS